jgi:hypothetical protein
MPLLPPVGALFLAESEVVDPTARASNILLVHIFGDGGAVGGKPGEIELHQRHLDALRRGQREVVEHVARSQEAIKRSLELLRLAGKIKDEQKPFSSKRDPF